MVGLPYIPIFLFTLAIGAAAVFADAKRLRFTKWVDFVIAGSLVLFAGLRGESHDYADYVMMFETVRDAHLQPFVERVVVGKDLFFGIVLIFLADIGFGVSSLFLTAALLSIGLKAIAFRNAFGSSLLALAVHFCT